MEVLIMKNEGRFLTGLCLSVVFALLMSDVPVYATATDEIIESAAKESFVFKNYLQDDNIVVESKDGIVTLTGMVTEESHKALAQEMVESIVGVVVVDNHLQIKSDDAKSSDAVIFSRVRLAIMSHRTLRGVDVRFIVENGVVSISGMAMNTAQIDLTTEYIKDVEGVKDVKNDMGVMNEQASTEKSMGEKVGDVGKKIGNTVDDVGKKIGNNAGNVAELIDDASITALVKATLMYHRSTSALNTRVGTRDGVVTLSGTAKNESARELATQVVQDVHGVKAVNNIMSLEINR
jgi:hyperosmotically inducible periplasmic protein